jgi:light-regulated signal transduction histidine kinase (bacteriophytochrome)/ActR/RegA family two-component response regulator
MTLQSVLTRCDLEPITRLERIQSFGFLLAMSSDWRVVRASANLAQFTGADAASALGAPLDSLVDREALHEIRNRLTGLASTGGAERIYGIKLVAGRPLLDIAVHYVGKLCVLEGEPAGLDSRVDAASLVRTTVSHLRKQPTLDAFHRDGARQIRRMTGFDRVMIYRFEADGSGEVIAEDFATGMESFLGLHYPASDIPVQARALYVRNAFRIIADVQAVTIPLLSSAMDAGEPLDLTLAITRAVSPAHIEYLRNMGVAASLSISIMVEGALWGLVACHHRNSRLPTFVIRTAAELFGEMYSLKLEARLRQMEDDYDRQARESAVALLTSVAANNELLGHASWLQEALRQMIPCDGIAICLKGHLSLSGSTPAAADVEGIAQLMDVSLAGQPFVTDHLAALRPQSSAHAALAAGVIGMVLSKTDSDYIMLFRRERLRDIKWAGEPVKIDTGGEAIPNVSPRKSFNAFTESIRGFSRPFTATEVKVAEALGSGLREVIRRETRAADAERATGRQELLIAELNHRVRNVLALIRGLISQTNGEEGDTSSYVASLNGRVQALARAHDRVSRQNSGPGPLNAIFDDEIAAYVPTQRHRFIIRGALVMLQPQAFSALALIVHELVTNCAKHGSLSDKGRVEVTLEYKSAAGLFMKWRELEGPSVQIPTRRGFGSVIIERVLPFELQGTALVHYLPAGLEADFFIPERHIASVSRSVADPVEPLTVNKSSDGLATHQMAPLRGLTVLLLEDNLIVALEAEDMLKALGAQSVQAASTIAAASKILETSAVHFAVLDINLGFETSLSLASRIRALNIPFIFASGYGENINVGTSNHSVLTVTKPYDRDDLRFAVANSLAASRGDTFSGQAPPVAIEVVSANNPSVPSWLRPH